MPRGGVEGLTVVQEIGSAASRRAVLLAALAFAVACSLPAAARGGSPDAVGADGLGDRFFPDSGNGGYQVARYDLDLSYDPELHRLRAVARIVASADQPLRRFNLDFRGPPITDLEVEGRTPRHRRQGQELVIVPDDPLERDERFEVVVRYRGTPEPIRFRPIGPIGWITTEDGAFVASQPNGAPTWFPCNDHPSDKADYRFRIEVPRGLRAVANGRLKDIRRSEESTEFVWEERDPMVTYAATVNIGKGNLDRSVADDLPYWSFVHPRVRDDAEEILDGQPAMLEIQRRLFGPYPFSSAGMIIDSDVGYPAALETQTRPLYDGIPSPKTAAHELAHQWFGNSVSVRRWKDIWLNEGFAEFGSWIWSERSGSTTAQEYFDQLERDGERYFGEKMWDPAPARPGTPEELFAFSVYMRGAMTLQALRTRLGDEAFFSLLRAWTRENRYGNATVKQFIGFAERESGEQLDRFFEEWLYEPGRPGSLDPPPAP